MVHPKYFFVSASIRFFILFLFRRGQATGPDGSILALTAFQQGVLSVSNSAVRLHSRGCLLRATFSGLVSECLDSYVVLLVLLVLGIVMFLVVSV